MVDLDVDARMLSIRLGLGDLMRPEPCMTYACGCVCKACMIRKGRLLTPELVKQPWELAA